MQVSSLLILFSIPVIFAKIDNHLLSNGLQVKVDTRTVGGCTDQPQSVESIIPPSAIGGKRTNFGKAEHGRRMDAMNAYKIDERGHIIASSLGGPAEIWNLFPQAKRLNSGPESEPNEIETTRRNWKGLERRVLKFLSTRSTVARKVQWDVHFSYTDRNRTCRPYDINVIVICYEGTKKVKCAPDVTHESYFYVNDEFGYNGAR